MGASQKLAAVVIAGLVVLGTILFMYLGDENNRITAEASEQQEVAIERATANYVSLCMQCHGPAGEGYTEPGAAGTGRIGAPLGGINTSLNQQGVNAAGTPVAGGLKAREDKIRYTITNGLKNPDGSVRMPAFGEVNGGPLNDEQVNQLVLMIQHGDWNHIYNQSIEYYGGYPTPPPAAATAAPDAASGGTAAGASADGSAVTIEMGDIFFKPTDVQIMANADITFTLTNNGSSPHNFAIDALKISVDVAAGETKTVTINAPVGEYEYYCNIPGHKEAGMVGKLVASDSAPAASSSSMDGSTAAPADAAASGDAAAGLTVDAVDIAFQPTTLEAKADTDTVITVTNKGAAPHNFAIDALKVSVDVAPGETKTVTINAPAGEYEYYCNVPGHKEAGMVGKLTVK